MHNIHTHAHTHTYTFIHTYIFIYTPIASPRVRDPIFAYHERVLSRVNSRDYRRCCLLRLL